VRFVLRRIQPLPAHSIPQQDKEPFRFTLTQYIFLCKAHPQLHTAPLLVVARGLNHMDLARSHPKFGLHVSKFLALAYAPNRSFQQTLLAKAFFSRYQLSNLRRNLFLTSCSQGAIRYFLVLRALKCFGFSLFPSFQGSLNKDSNTILSASNGLNSHQAKFLF
jgi:hypothetical protein